MANRIPTLLATAVTVACSLSAHAAAENELNRAGCGNQPVRDQAPEHYAKVVLYSDVTIAQDSACSWGIWEQLEPTAAGPQTPLPPLAAGGGDKYRPVGLVQTPTTATPEVPIVVPVDPGSVGKLVGFGVIYPVSGSSSEQPQAVGGGSAPDRQAFKLETDASSWMPPSVTVSTVSIRESVPAFDNFGPMTLTGGNIHQRDFANDSPIESGSLITDLGSVSRELATAPSQLDHFNGELTRYVGGAQAGESANSRPSVQVYGVWGVSTSANDMAVLMRNDVTVTYTGYMVNEGNVRSGRIDMTAAFGQGTFNATVNGGRDQAGVTFQTTAGGKGQLQGPVGFYMNGTITGSTWQATSFSADDLARDRKTRRQPVLITGAASGAFIGPQAAAVIGAVDITKSNSRTTPGSNAPVYSGGQYVSSFVAVKQVPK